MVGSQQYDAFGASRNQSGVQLPFTYTGEQTDAESGLVYLRARYLDPSTGRFLSRDPFPGLQTDPRTQHPYAYVGNDPTNLTDPSGQNPFAACAVALAGGPVAFGACEAVVLAAAGVTALCVATDCVAATGELVSAMQGADNAPARNDTSAAPTPEPVVTDTDVAQPAATGTEVAQPVPTAAAAPEPTVEAIPTPVAVPTPCPSAEELLADQGATIGTPGNAPDVRVVEDVDELDALWDTITAEGTPTYNPRYAGDKEVLLPNGTRIGSRQSIRYGPTIDVNVPGDKPFRVHVKEWPPK